MPPSQLKRLKSSLREQGITGPQKSKKQKKSTPKTHHADRSAALQQIRDSFNPFELKLARPAKFESVSHKAANAARNGGRYKEVLHRPGVTKSAGEEMRRRQLLPEMQRRNKIGAVVDRRIGEGDTTMTPEERAVQRFAREKSTKKGGSMFDLEASDDEGGVGLTHMGRRLDELVGEDFVDDIGDSDVDGSEGDTFMRPKRRRESEEDGEDKAADMVDEQPERKKTKKEVMEEIIVKSKTHKYERQKVKEDDDDLRDELDKGMADMLALLQGHKPPPPKPSQLPEAAVTSDGPVMNADRQRLLDGMDRQKADKEYEVRLRQLAQDSRAQPADRTKTAEERAKDEATRLKELEEKRERRMRGEDVSDDEFSGGDRRATAELDGAEAPEDDEDELDEAAEFGFASSNAPHQADKEEEKVVHEDEDEFTFDEDLVASVSDVELSDESDGSDPSDTGDDTQAPQEADEEDEFVKGIFGDAREVATGSNKPLTTNGIAYTYPCPRTHTELLEVFRNVSLDQIPTVVQRIRALHHPSLSAANKESMADFSAALVDHISYMGTAKQPLATIEQLTRHLHSLSRTYPTEIASAFRKHLHGFHERGQPTAGDLVILTAIGSIYPTSDHFHQVVTPAITLMARWLSLNNPADSEDRQTTGAFLVALCLDYQKLSRRYVPETIRFTLRTLSIKPSLTPERLRPHLNNIVKMSDLWHDKTAFTEIMTPFLPLLQKSTAKKEHHHLRIKLQQSRLLRRPLELHHHRLQPIRTSIPKFEEGFNPDKHYDPDKERSDSKKLQKEYKRERKGAVRELRKDANFIAREQLKDKRERDAEYEKKQRRLIAEIQGEEGHEAKSYEREKAGRKRAKRG